MAELEVKSEGRLKVTEENEAAKVEKAHLKRVREVAKEARKTYSELSKVRKAAEREVTNMQGAAQRGVNIDPRMVQSLQNLFVKLTELENQSNALSQI